MTPDVPYKAIAPPTPATPRTGVTILFVKTALLTSHCSVLMLIVIRLFRMKG
jgi:hypothetical protein